MGRAKWWAGGVVLTGIVAVVPLVAQPPGPPPDGDKKDVFTFGPPGKQPKRELVKQFDTNGDGWLNDDERKPAREAALKSAGRGGFGKGGPPGGMPKPKMARPGAEPPRPGPRVAPSDVANHADAPLYDPAVLRTVFIDFTNDDWEKELEAFRNTDVDVPATLTVDGKIYRNVGVHFRGMSSYMMVGTGSKRSFNVSLDLADPKQRLSGSKTLNLLNCAGDPSMMSTVLYSHIARQFIPAPKANFVRVVINGESWGVYCNVQQFDKEFLAENYKTKKGARWKVVGSPGGRGGLEYTGDEVAEYRKRFEIKSTDNESAWRDLIKLCRTLNETPPDQLVAALSPMLDIEGVLRFLALDVALVNSDGYWVRASDFSLYQDDKGVFHVIPHDMNEAFSSGSGGPGFGPPGGRGGPPRGRFGPPDGDPKDKFGPPGPGGMAGRGGGVTLDPLVGLDNPRTPLRAKLLAVPELRARYLEHVRAIAADQLDWAKLGPVVAAYRRLIESEVRADTRKLESFEAFDRATADAAESPAGGDRGPGGMSLRAFADGRRKYLLEHPAIKNLGPAGSR